MTLNSKNFNKYLKKNYKFEERPFFAVAVSGGPDSMALLTLLDNWKKTVKGNLIALIVNHNLRSEFKKEITPILKYLKEKKFKTKVLIVNKKNVATKSMKEARENRYSLLTRFCKKNNILHLFLAHQKDDNLETFVNRRIAGSNFEGLISIRNISIRDKISIIRPMLEYSKFEILKYNEKNKVPFLNDPSNENLNYTRPIIRKFLSQIDKNIYKNIKNEFKLIKDNSQFYKFMVSESLIKNIIYNTKNRIEIKINNLCNLNFIISSKLIDKIYRFLFDQNTYLRSKKIEIFINELKNPKFRQFNLKGMYIKKDKDILIFTKKAV